MARKSKSQQIDFDTLLAEENIVTRDVVGEMEDASLNYAVKTIIDRALPDIRDGLKPVQRRILYAMGEMGLIPTHSYVKSAKISGEVMGNYHPHGDSYGAMANMVHELGIRYSMVDGQGNYGHPLDGDSPASSRYTEARLDKKGAAMLRDVKKRVVDFKANYSEDSEEPIVLPGAFPFLLANGATGIATGYTTEIPSHNVKEIMDAAIAFLKNPELTSLELMKYVKGPDLPTGGYLIQSDEIVKLYETGRASLKYRAKMHVEVKDDGSQQIVITELPPDVRKADIDKKPGLVTKLYDLCIADKKIPRVLNVRDESTGKKDKKTGKIENPVRIVIELHKTAVPEVIMAELYKQTALEKSKGYIMRAISNQSPVLVTLRDAISAYVDHRKDVVKRRIQFDLNKAETRLHLLEGFKKILINIDDVIKIIRNSVDPEKDLVSTFGLSKAQVKAVLDMPLRRLSKLEENKIDNDITEVTTEIEGYRSIIGDTDIFEKLLLDEFLEIKKEFGDNRKTEIISESDVMNASNVSDEPMVVIITNKNNVKQIPQSAFEDMIKAGSLRERTEVYIQGVNCTTDDQFTIILETGEYVNTSFRDLLGMLDFLEEKKIVSIVSHGTEENNKQVIVMTKKGMVKKTEMKSFRARARRVAPYINLNGEDDSIVSVKVSDGDELNTLVVATQKGIIHRFYEKGFSSSNPGGNGVPGISPSIIEEGDHIVDFAIIKEGQDDKNSVIMYIKQGEEYLMKSTLLEEFRVKGRVSKGIVGAGADLDGEVYLIKVTNDDFYVIDKKGLVHKQRFVSIPIQNRYNKPNAITINPIVADFFID